MGIYLTLFNLFNLNKWKAQKKSELISAKGVIAHAFFKYAFLISFFFYHNN